MAETLLQDDALQQLLADTRGSFFFCELCCLAGGYELPAPWRLNSADDDSGSILASKVQAANKDLSLQTLALANLLSGSTRPAGSEELCIGRRWLHAALTAVAETLAKHRRVCHR